jgi:hypothetical protein
MKRRTVLTGTAAAIGTALIGTATLTERAVANVSADFELGGASVTTDNGQLTSLTVDVTSGEATYDGLDETADEVRVNLYAALDESTVFGDSNRIDTTSGAVADSDALNTRAGRFEFTFNGVDVLSSSAFKKNDFAATGDGTETKTTVAFGLEFVVTDSAGATLLSKTTTTRSTVTVTNEESSGGVSGNGGVTASGNNQEPGNSNGK